jgi:hypothetical protein
MALLPFSRLMHGTTTLRLVEGAQYADAAMTILSLFGAIDLSQ